MADQKITDLTADASPSSDDLIITVNDPAGTPANRKVTLGNAIGKAHGLGNGVLKTAAGAMAVATEGTDYYKPGGTDVAVADGGTGSSTASGARTNLGLVIGTDVVAPNQDTTGKSAKTDALNSASTVVNVASATAPTTGQILTATDSTHATWQTPAAAGATPRFVYTTDFTAALTASGGRWTSISKGGTGAGNYSAAEGFYLTTGANANSYAYFASQTLTSANWNIWDKNMSCWGLFSINYSANTRGGFTWGFGQSPGGGPDVPGGGFKSVGFYDDFTGGAANSSPQAFCSNGTSVTNTSVSGWNHVGTFITLYITQTSGTNVKYYVDGVLKATITTNVPAGTSNGYGDQITIGGSNGTATGNSYISPYMFGFGYDLI